jgi:hypothetical protein
VYPTLFHCAASGDDFCAGGQVDPHDPSMISNINYDTNASAFTVVAAGRSYIDPRLGTANLTSGQALARVGVLRGTASAAVSSIPPLNSTSPNLMRLGTTATASFSDAVTVVPSDPALSGMPGTFTASFVVHGSLDASEVNGRSIYVSSMGYASWELLISAGVTSVNATGYEYVGANYGLGEGAVVNITAPIVFGTPFTLSANFEAKAVATVDAAVVRPLTEGLTVGNAVANYMSTARWNGIQSVKSGNQAVAAFSVVSGSGVDYAKPVVEPGLTITRAGTDLMISWPNSFVGYALESAAAVDSGSWSPAGSPVNTNGNYQLILPLLETAQFFRLRHP